MLSERGMYALRDTWICVVCNGKSTVFLGINDMWTCHDLVFCVSASPSTSAQRHCHVINGQWSFILNAYGFWTLTSVCGVLWNWMFGKDCSYFFWKLLILLIWNSFLPRTYLLPWKFYIFVLFDLRWETQEILYICFIWKGSLNFCIMNHKFEIFFYAWVCLASTSSLKTTWFPWVSLRMYINL